MLKSKYKKIFAEKIKNQGEHNMLNEFDDIEIKVMDDLSVETKDGNQKNDSQAFGVSKLNEEIELEKQSRKLAKNNIENFKKSQKPKKSLKTKILAWGLGLGIFAGAVAGGTALYKDQTTGNGAYNDVLKSKYEKVDETLNKRVFGDAHSFDSAKNKKINSINFKEVGDEFANLEIYTEAEQDYSDRTDKLQGTSKYSVLKKYYDSLVDAESSNNMITYLDCLNELFENMNFESFDYSNKISNLKGNWCLPLGEDNINKLFALDFEKEGIVKQIGFLPFNIEVVDWTHDVEAGVINYTYKLSGISYCETTFESHDEVKESDSSFVQQEYNKNNVKAYFRDFTFTSSQKNGAYCTKQERLTEDLKLFLYDEKSNFEIKTTYFEETNVFNPLKEYENMKSGNFNYQKPDDIDLNEYKK